MKRRIAIFSVVAALASITVWSVFTTNAQERRRAEFTTRLSSPNCVVHIRAKWANNEGCVGTGVVIDENGKKSVLTAAHVINRGGTLEVVFGGRDGRATESDEKLFAEFQVQYAQFGRDAAKLTRVKIPDWVVPARVARSSPPVGTIVTSYGLYDPDALRVRQARLIEGPNGENEQERIYVGVTSEPGDSGSPIFNEDGEVVAVLEGWEDWWDQKSQTKVDSGPWGSRIEVRRWAENKKATRGPRMFDTKFRGY